MENFKDLASVENAFNAKASELYETNPDTHAVEQQVATARALMDYASTVGTATGLMIASKALELFTTNVETQKLALIDSVTGLLNRNGILTAGESRLAYDDRHNHATSIFFLDLNKFKPINDELGHDEGDAALKLVGEKLKATLRKEDIVGRLGGDEFVIIMTNENKKYEFETEHKKIEKLFKDGITYRSTGGGAYPIGASVGMALVGNGEEIGAAIKRADKLMYVKKEKSTRQLNTTAPSDPSV